MISDLLARGNANDRSADVVVIGAGIAGLIIATTLAEAGHRVLVLESGSDKQREDTHPLNTVEQTGDATYHGAIEGRARCLGGTSTRWGGALLPMLPQDCFAQPSGWDFDWLGIYPELVAQLDRAEALFSLPSTPYDDDRLAALATNGTTLFIPRLPKWPTFGRRNVASLLGDKIADENGPEVVLNATVTAFRFESDGNLSAVEAQAPDGSHLVAKAPRFVMAAGAIESTRLLLLADRQANDRIFAPYDVLGRYFYDHLSVNTATLDVHKLTDFNRHFGFRFEGNGMRSLRFEVAEALKREHDLPSALAQITFGTDHPGGFDATRQMLRRFQRRELPTAPDMRAALTSSPWIARAAWWRYVHKRLLYPSNGYFHINVIVEQMPRPDNRITLGSTADIHGNPLARIDWSVGERDRCALVTVGNLFIDAWRNSSYGRLAHITPIESASVEHDLTAAGGTSHPGGSTRIGRSARDGVLDRDLRAFGIPNLTVTATSVFPNAGAANPTLMLILASLRAADRISEELRR